MSRRQIDAGPTRVEYCMLMTATKPTRAPLGSHCRNRLLVLWISATLLCATIPAQAQAQAQRTEKLKIPNLGESSTSLFSAEYEYQLGRAWLRVFRSQVATVNDPLLFSYLENLVFQLVTESELQDRRLELVVVDNAAINAFAVPGGVIGI
ncbi:MAG: putative Zn-dependent protease, partial [Congregibacter sp.]